MILSVIAVIGVFSSIIIIHELGHYIFARRAGVKVEKFSIGFGRRLLGIKRGQTEFVISLIPFGGYVKMAGELVTDKLSGAPDEFLSKSPGARARIIFAGPALNYLLAYVIFCLIFILGQPVLSSRIGELVDGYPAQEAGLKAGDEIIAIDGKNTESWDDITEIIHQSAGKTLAITIRRDGEESFFQIRPKENDVVNIFNQTFKVGQIGIRPAEEDFKIVRHNPLKAVWLGGKYLFSMSALTLKFFYFILTGAVAAKDAVAGPVGISMMIGKAAHLGLIYLLHLMAILSMSLAIINLFPIPILDGGHLLFLGIERLRRRPVSARIQGILNNVFFVLLISLMLLVTWGDILKQFK